MTAQAVATRPASSPLPRLVRRQPAPPRVPPKDALAEIVDGLTHPDPGVRARSARGCGRARLEPSVPLLADRLLDPEAGVRAAAARALGRIGGWQAAAPLLRALRTDRVPAAQLCRDLARGAPDHCLEQALRAPEHRRSRPALALAIGLRGRAAPAAAASAVAELLDGTAVERSAACHALGALGSQAAAGALEAALHDPTPEVVLAAGGALLRLGHAETARAVLGERFRRGRTGLARQATPEPARRRNGSSWRWWR